MKLNQYLKPTHRLIIVIYQITFNKTQAENKIPQRNRVKPVHDDCSDDGRERAHSLKPEVSTRLLFTISLQTVNHSMKSQHTDVNLKFLEIFLKIKFNVSVKQN